MKILLVEDHEDSRDILANLLTRCGHEVNAAGSVRDAIDLLDAFEFEGLICDIGLPDGSGLELAAEAKRRQEWKRMVALTGREREDEKELGLATAFDAYLTKPFDLHELRTLFANPPEFAS
jgi:two-component system, chemotaxis family, CheB/CheR fusion protein